ncbi:Tm-1-like ATP-binding domain-containing protein [Gryllotalpicola protaetiae]|uniref:UPF0261 family protein n=1 Tax=Gryllotalpicola protaetiae TaxID=2419771 RepID=A0A387BLC3_9MICO|nr:Tm-1-like ATP-binding domain-containing protein [Gryllotalpicola protaetiae]AYG02874.1 UPF0261 family protein [Gryllotalpicola protaetiae]
MPTVVLAGTLDTKGPEYEFVRTRLREAGVDVVLVDTGVLGSPSIEPDIPRDRVAAAAQEDLEALTERHDRGAAISVMSRGLTAVVAGLRREGRCDGALALGGTGGTSLASAAFRQLPLGVPKIIVSTAASGNTSAYVGETDLVLMPSVVDIAGVNRISAPILANAAAALTGMVLAAPPHLEDARPLVAASMFGVTTPCITTARDELERRGYEVIVFHMTGTGGRALESLVSHGVFAGVLDVTTTELADELVGGVFDAGPERGTAAGRLGVPQVVSVGALDMVNFGPKGTVPEKFRERNLYVHNPTTTLMRTTPEECAELGRRLASRVASAKGPTAVYLPLRGVSAIDVEGEPFFDADADARLFDAVRAGLRGSGVELVELDTDVNDPEFAHALVERLCDEMAAVGAEEYAK